MAPFPGASFDEALDALLAGEPPPFVMACDESGLIVPVPPAVPCVPGRAVEGAGSALELCVTADMRPIIDAFIAVRSSGRGCTPCHLRDAPEQPIMLHFFDARTRYGAILGIFVGAIEKLGGAAHRPARLFRPRLLRFERNSMGQLLALDDAATTILGWSKAELLGRNVGELIHPDDRDVAFATWMEALARPDFEHRSLCRYQRRDGSYIWLESTHRNKLKDPASQRIFSELIDVTERMEAIEALRESEQLLRRVTEALPIGIVQIDAQRRIIYRNERVGEILGIDGATIAEQFAFVAAGGGAELDAALRELLAGNTAPDLEVTVDHPHGARRCGIVLRPLNAENGTVTGAIAAVSDITERVRMRDELEARATFDQLTGCRNRAAILATLRTTIEAVNRAGCGLAVLFIDLDHFKGVNDRLGHAAGDELLCHVAARLASGARTEDVIGRLGGDEFLVVCPGVDSAEAALAIARRVTASIGRCVIIGAAPIVPSASIGVAWTDAPTDADALIARADAAMYESKRARTGPALFATAT